jgi:DNA-binding CsgD family transcriptional regulator
LIAYVTRDASQFEHARTMAEAVLSLPVDIPLYTAMGRAALALQAIQQHDAAAASEHYDALKAVSGIMLLYVSTDRVLALLAQTMEKLDLAMAHFEDALAFCHQAGYRPELAWTCHDYADALVHRNGPGDHAKALSLLNEALNISSELGMQPLAERVAARQEGLEQHGRGDTLTVHAYPDGLTQREVEVLQFIAGGKSNSEIAEVLVLSVRTVERHITNIYAKINARGRADATSYALGHGLTH